jgi:two-component system sensor kinase FixL
VVFVGARDISTYSGLRERAERSEALATAILRTAVDPIIVIERSGIIVDANQSTSDLFGYAFDELIGSNVSMLMPEPYRSEHDGYLTRYLTEGDARIIGIGREVQAQRADGTVFPMALAVSEVKTDTDHLFTGIIHDLTERNRQSDELFAANTELEARVSERTEQLKELLDEVQRSNRDLEQFAYIASHDLQAPLRNVRQGLELLDEHLQETVGALFDDEAQELRDLVIAAVLRMEELIRGLLAYSRIQQKHDQDRDVIDLNQVVGDVVTILTPEIHAVGGTITADQLPEIVADPIQLGQVFQNLIENALRYRSPDRDLAIAIECREVTGGQLTVAVVDNGCGIEAAHHERIFELFRRGHSGYDGVGLGLAICQRIVEGHGGKIWVESEAGNGATFLFELAT